MSKKDGRMKKWCEDYRRSGKKEINKDLKAKKHLKRLEHFASRKEEGKAYSYTPPKDKKERAFRAKKNVDRRLPIQRWDSLFAKVDFELEQKALNEKEKKKKSN